MRTRVCFINSFISFVTLTTIRSLPKFAIQKKKINLIKFEVNNQNNSIKLNN